MKDDEPIQPNGPEAQSQRPMFTIQLSAGSFVAICSCGWKGPPLPSAGLAGARWDGHVVADHEAIIGGADH